MAERFDEGKARREAPVEAHKGLSEGDSQNIKEDLNIKTVKDLGTDKFFLWAQSVAKLAE